MQNMQHEDAAVKEMLRWMVLAEICINGEAHILRTGVLGTLKLSHKMPFAKELTNPRPL